MNGADTALLRLARAVRDTGYGFVTVTPETHRRVNARPGNEWATDLAGVFGWSRPFRDGTVPAEIVALMRDADVLRPDGDGWRSTVRLSSLDDGLFLHSAYPTTSPDSVFFGPDTYRYVRAVTAALAGPEPVRRAVDIGSGAGPAAIAIARRRPQAEVFGADINRAALRLTALNAELNGVGVQCRESNLLAGIEGGFDLIVANPPYLIDPGERRYRHGGGALGEGLSLAIVRAAIERLEPGGRLVLYTGVAIVNGIDRFRMASQDQLRKNGFAWTYEEVDPDVFGEELSGTAYAGADRIAAVVLTAKKPE